MMTGTILVVATSSLLAAAPPRQAAAQEDLEAMNGNWVIESFVRNGEEIPVEQSEGRTITFGDTSWTRSRSLPDGSVVKEAEGEFTLDPSQTPPAIDFTIKGQEEKQLGIYDIEGDTLTTCIARPGEDRPTEIKSDEGSHHVLVIYKRKAL